MRKLSCFIALAGILVMPSLSGAQRVAIYTESYQSDWTALAATNGWTVDFWNSGDALLGPISTYDALVVGWRGDISSFSPLLSSGSAISAARGSRTVLTGQDPDYHYPRGHPAAGTFMENAVNWVLGGTGLGVFVLSDYDNSWMNQSGSFLLGETVITEGKHSNGVTLLGSHPVHAGVTSANMGNWGNAVHNTFSSFDPSYSVVSTAHVNGEALTLVRDTGVGIVPEPSTILLTATGLAGVLLSVARRRGSRPS